MNNPMNIDSKDHSSTEVFKQREHTLKDIILSIVLILWFFGSIGVCLYFKDTSTAIVLITIAQIFVVLAGAWLIKEIKEKRRLSSLSLVLIVFILVGLLAGIYGFTMIFGDDAANAFLMSLLPHLFAIGFILFGAVSTTREVSRLVKYYKACTTSLDVICVEARSYYAPASKGGSRLVYSPIWQGVYNGKTLVFHNDTYTNTIYEEGYTEIIKFNPNDPSQYIDSVFKSGVTTDLIISLSSLIAGIVAEVCIILNN